MRATGPHHARSSGQPWCWKRAKSRSPCNQALVTLHSTRPLITTPLPLSVGTTTRSRLGAATNSPKVPQSPTSFQGPSPLALSLGAKHCNVLVDSATEPRSWASWLLSLSLGHPRTAGMRRNDGSQRGTRGDDDERPIYHVRSTSQCLKRRIKLVMIVVRAWQGRWQGKWQAKGRCDGRVLRGEHTTESSTLQHYRTQLRSNLAICQPRQLTYPHSAHCPRLILCRRSETPVRSTLLRSTLQTLRAHGSLSIRLRQLRRSPYGGNLLVSLPIFTLQTNTNAISFP
ncbi:hypothetical protein EDB80DRAFT_345043 [Ilyonectria destructans]|nr:hypothetical protein EDB80DRAFT_345043 [Ilyonectria destructans]